jgi:NTP pyrophosphatase (non-canonical NTP hydrolase)
MTINEYQQLALRTESPTLTETLRILQGAMGLCRESGEYIDILKKHIFQGHDLNKEHMAKELGDIAWYLAVSAAAIGYDLETVFQMNIDKLKARYPDGFEADRSTHRKDDDI